MAAALSFDGVVNNYVGGINSGDRLLSSEGEDLLQHLDEFYYLSWQPTQKINNKHIESFILDMASGIGRQNGSWRGAETSCIVSNGVVV